VTAARARWTTVVFFVIVSAVLAAWALAVPVFEAPDEPAHWQFARYLHDHWALPIYQPGFEEGYSPPLYYLALAPIAVPSRLPSTVVVNDVAGQPVSLAPPRRFLNSDRDLAWYWPVVVARLLTAAMALLTVWIVYRTAAGVTDWRGGLTAAAIVAFLPQFSFRMVTVSNDAPVTMFGAVITWACVRLLQRGFTWQRGVGAALALACAYLSKASATVLIAPLALALVEAPAAATATSTAAPSPSTWTSTSLIARVTRLTVLLVALAIVLPWTLRNVRLYGDPFVEHARSVVGSDQLTYRSLFSTYFLWHFPVVLTASFTGLFGWENVPLPTWAYAALRAFWVILLGGLIRGWFARTVDRRLVRVLALTVLALIGFVVYLNLSFTAPQGRFLLPALPALALLAVLGLRSLPLPASVAGRAHAILPVGLGVFNVWCLAFVLMPAYYPALARDVAPGVRVLFPAAAYGLALVAEPVTPTQPRTPGGLPTDLRFRIVGEDPLWILPADIESSSFSALEVELTSDLPGAPTVQGTVFFAGPDQPIGENRRVDFRWTANGARQTVRVDLAAHPEWRGAIAHLRIDPINVGAEAFVDREVRLSAVRLHKAAPAIARRTEEK
jgi:hypothetical protein